MQKQDKRKRYREKGRIRIYMAVRANLIYCPLVSSINLNYYNTHFIIIILGQRFITIES